MNCAVELGVVIGKPARQVSAGRAMEHVAGYVCAVDVTARDWQQKAMEGGLPWSLAKGCDTFLPFSKFIPKESVPVDAESGMASVELYLDVNGVRKQEGSTRDMVFTIPQLIEHISKYVTLDEWDLILTGTPEGVGPIKPGDVVKAGIKGLVELEVPVAKRNDAR